MGYSVYITRRRNWFDETGPDIPKSEWDAFVADNPRWHPCPDLGENFASFALEEVEEQHWICWDAGNLETKNPSQEFLVVLYEIAERLDAQLVGEEGKRYNARGEEASLPPALRISWRDWLADFKATLAFYFPRHVKKSPFKVGDRVKTRWGREGRIVKVDMKALGGMGIIEVDFAGGNIIGFSGDEELEKLEN